MLQAGSAVNYFDLNGDGFDEFVADDRYYQRDTTELSRK